MWFACVGQACERYSFYGMRSILVIFLTQYLHLADNIAEGIFHIFVAGCFLMPLAGEQNFATRKASLAAMCGSKMWRPSVGMPH